MNYPCLLKRISATILVFSIVQFSDAQQNLPIGTNLETIDYPYPTRYLALTIQGESLKMAYMDVIPTTPNGETVLLMHGKNFNGAYWEQTANDLAAKGYRVVIPDQIGFGKSSKPNRIQYSFQLLALNTKQLLDSLRIGKAHVLGHSMGGMLATRFALMFPAYTQTLILENPIGLEDWKTVVPYQTVENWYKSELAQTYDKIKNYQLTFYYDNKWKPQYDRWVHMLAGWTHDIDYPRIAWNSALLYDMIFTQPVVYEFGNIRSPTLLIIGQRDRTALGKALLPQEVQKTLGNYPLLGRKTAEAIPDAQLVEIGDVGHLPHIEAYDQFIRPLIAFLAAHSSN